MAAPCRTLPCLVLLALAAGAGAGPEESVPPDLQATIFVRVLAYDRSLRSRAGASVVVGVVFRASDRASSDAQADIVRAFGGLQNRTIQELPLKVVPYAYKDAAELTSWVAREGVVALYVTPGLAAELEAIRKVCAQRKLAALSPLRSYVEQGLAVGVVPKENKPGIVVNRTAAEAFGMDLDPKLLQLSEVLR